MFDQDLIADWNMVSKTGEVPDGMHLLSEDTEFKIARAKEITDKSGSKRMRLTGVIQRANSFNENGRIYSGDVLSEAVDSIQEALMKRKVMGELDHPCVSSSDFRVLTVDGWKDFNDIKTGDYVYSRVGGEMVRSKVLNIINEPYVGDIYHLKGRNIDLEITAPHKVIMDTRDDGAHIKRQIESTIEEIANNRSKYNKCRIPRTAEWVGNDQEFMVIPGVKEEDLPSTKSSYKHDVTEDLIISMKDYVSFLGLYLAEGYVDSHSHHIEICQIKDKYKSDIRSMLGRLPISWNEHKRGFGTSDIRLHRHLKPLGNCYNKSIPNEIKQLNTAHLKELIAWFAKGDGRDVDFESGGRMYNRKNVFSVSKRLIQDLHECLIKSGGCGNYQEIICDEDYIFADHLIESKNRVPLWQLNIATTKNIYLDERFLEIDKKHHDGNIYCLTTEHGSFYMEHKNYSYWTGNCDAKIHMDRVSHLMTKVWMEDNAVIGELEVIEAMPCGQMLAALVRAGVTIGISSRGIGDMKPTMTEGMQEAFEVLPGFRFVTWDTVAEPSVKEAELSVMESKQRLVGKKRIEAELLKEFINTLRGTE